MKTDTYSGIPSISRNEERIQKMVRRIFMEDGRVPSDERFVHALSVGKIGLKVTGRTAEATPHGNRSDMLYCANYDPNFKLIFFGDKIWVDGVCSMCPVIFHRNDNSTMRITRMYTKR